MVLSVSGAVVAGCATGVAVPAGAGSDPTGRPPRSAGRGPYVAASAQPTREAVSYVALGDSYTIGTSVKTEERWPDQLVRTLRSEIDLRLVANLGVNGYTTADLIADELPQLDSLDPEFVSLQIGVNDVVRRISPEQYRENLAAIFDDLVERVGAERILAVSTPDYTLTPEGPRLGDAERQSNRVRRFNEILREEADERHVRYVDITSVAERVRQDASLVASDGLHPSGKQYAGWVELIAPQVREMLGDDT